MKSNIRLRPLGDRVVVYFSNGTGKTAGGLYIPDAAKELPQEGTVVAVGPGRYDHGTLLPIGVTVNDRVLVSKFGGIEVKLDGQEYKIFSADDIVAILD